VASRLGPDRIKGSESLKSLYTETDHLDTVRAARSSSGQVVWRWDSDAFGALKPNEDPDGDGQKITTITMRFPGQIADRLHPAVYNWNRYYDPTSGRFVSSDPIGLDGGINTYRYVENNPMRWGDPIGLRILPNKTRSGPADPFEDAAKRGKRFCVSRTNSLEECVACCGDPRRPLFEKLADQSGGSNCVLKCTDKYKMTRACN
jgi:RHS repeat-associated protein